MADELYPGYDPLIDPNPITCWGHPTAEQLDADAARERERIPNYQTLWFLNEAMWRAAWTSAQQELWEREPWMRQFPELFRAR